MQYFYSYLFLGDFFNNYNVLLNLRIFIRMGFNLLVLICNNFNGYMSFKFNYI